MIPWSFRQPVSLFNKITTGRIEKMFPTIAAYGTGATFDFRRSIVRVKENKEEFDGSEAHTEVLQLRYFAASVCALRSLKELNR
jgi:hypothetical protein